MRAIKLDNILDCLLDIAGEDENHESIGLAATNYNKNSVQMVVIDNVNVPAIKKE